MTYPKAIVLADMHIREDQPVAWTSSYWDAQQTAVDYISGVQKEKSCAVFVAGDLFDKWNPSYELFTWAIENLPDKIFVVPGQHDLQHHNLKKLSKTALNALNKTNEVNVLTGECVRFRGDESTLMDIYGYPFGKHIESPKGIRRGGIENVAICHELVYKRRKPFVGCKADNAIKILKRMKGFDLVCTGDNHQSFTATYKDRLLINAGSMLPMTAEQKDYQPRLFLWYGGTEFETLDIPIPRNCISREHIEKKKAKDKKMEAFISELGNDAKVTLDFKKNVERAIKTGEVRKPVEEIIWEALDA